MQTLRKNQVIVFANPACNYDMQTGNISVWRIDISSPPRADSEVSRIRGYGKQGPPFEMRLVARKNGGASAEKKDLRNAKSHLKPPEFASSFEGPGGNQILFAVA